ncbi:MAG: hypothetical protein WCP53_01595 [Verrucomicrobiota bacterium]
MRRPSAIVLSLALNALLLLALAWQERPSAGRVAARPTESAPAPAGAPASSSRTTSDGSAAGETSTPAFDWSQLPMDPWAAYREGLRRIGCPDRTVRAILEPVVRHAYSERARALAAPYVGQFWQFAVPPSKARQKPLEDAAKALEEEMSKVPEALFRGLGGQDDGVSGPDPGTEAQLGFLSSAVRDRAADALLRNQERTAEFHRTFQGDDARRHQEGVKGLEAELDADLDSFLTPEEKAQFKLRRSPFAQLRELEGIRLTEEELAKIVRSKEETAAKPMDADERLATESAELAKLLGPGRAAEFARAQNGDFQSLVRLADRLEVPADQATWFWDSRRQASELAKNAMNDPALTDADRQAQLTAVRGWIGKKAEIFLGGGRGRATWERAEKKWLDQQFKLPDPDPLAPPAPTPTP